MRVVAAVVVLVLISPGFVFGASGRRVVLCDLLVVESRLRCCYFNSVVFVVLFY